MQNSGSFVELAVGAVIILASFLVIFRKFTNKSSSGCSGCSSCPSSSSCTSKSK